MHLLDVEFSKTQRGIVMLLPDNIHPELSIYFNGSIVLKYLINDKEQSIIELFERVKAENDMSFSVFVLSLDWLYLIEAAKINMNGLVKLCS